MRAGGHGLSLLGDGMAPDLTEVMVAQGCECTGHHCVVMFQCKHHLNRRRQCSEGPLVVGRDSGGKEGIDYPGR